VTSKASEVQETSAQLSRASSDTASAAEEIGASILEVSKATEESAQTGQQIATGSEQLALNATDAATSMSSLEKAIDQVLVGSTEQQAASAAAFEVSQDGSTALSSTIGSMEKIERQVGLSAEVVKELGEKQQEIGAIVQTISEIAEQTNLLALNAAIEAARAGEQGRGFAVVADEVRKLAERSSTATREIADLISSVRAGVDTAIQSMGESASQVSEGAAHSSSAREALNKILESIESVQSIAKRNDELVREMAQNAKSVSSAVSNVASISEETAACAQEMSASNEEVSASAQQVSEAVGHQTNTVQSVDSMARQLNATADELQSLVRVFRLGESEKPRLHEAA
jgi:methyl-accepting chemotaxis protein